jgi:hypothetical protein
MVAELSPLMSVESIRLNLKQKINCQTRDIRGCALLPDGRMVFSSHDSKTVIFISKDGLQLLQFILKIPIVLLYHLGLEVTKA